MQSVSKITLDAETFKALASATRLTVLKALDERRKTLTELAKDLDLNKATVHEHLGLLLAAGLVRKRDDEGRKWIYYELTWTGQRILRPEATTTFNVLLGLSALAAGGGVLMLGRALDWWLSGSSGQSAVEDGAGDNSDALRASEEADQSAPAASSASGTQTSSAGSGTAAPDETTQNALLYDDGGAGMASDKGGDAGFFDDGGWIALALVGAFLAFCALAWYLHWKLTPKPFDPEAAARAEADSPEPST
jgi:DNA-binding transcriptional ArsR family regulator